MNDYGMKCDHGSQTWQINTKTFLKPGGKSSERLLTGNVELNQVSLVLLTILIYLLLVSLVLNFRNPLCLIVASVSIIHGK